jgi:hypothetical protein
MSACGGQQTDVCYAEALEWRKCLKQTFAAGKAQPQEQPMDATCVAQRGAFDRCVTEWRGMVGPSVKLRGDNPCEPPAQCMPMACIYEDCMANSTYNHKKCTGAMQQFKHCVKALHGSEYVLD